MSVSKAGVATSGALRVEIRRDVDPLDWDHRVLDLGGHFFQSHGQIAYEASGTAAHPLFLEAFDDEGRLGLATAVLSTPRLPVLARVCKEVHFNALPAVRDGSAESQRAVLAAFERELGRLGVFRTRVGSLLSPHSARVLPDLGYTTTRRFEFYLDLEPDIEANWQNLPAHRRKTVRKATNKQLVVAEESNRDGVRTLTALNHQAMGRKEVETAELDRDVEAFDRLMGRSAGRVRLFVCRLDGTAVGAVAFSIFADTCYNLMSGTSPEGNHCHARVFLHWKMTEALTSWNVRTWVLGAATIPPGVDPYEDGLFVFKQRFGTRPVEQPSGWKVLSGPGVYVDWARRGCKRIASAMRGHVHGWLTPANPGSLVL